jgi:hypothetical protein
MRTNSVKDQWELGFTIGGKEYPSPSPDNVIELLWFESVHQSLPSLNMTFKDETGEFVELVSAGDGTIVEVSLGDGRGQLTTASFNIQGSPQIDHGRGYYSIKINAVLDAVAYNRSIPTGLYEGSSADVIGRLASEHGLNAKTAGSTSDSQVWLPTLKTAAQWVKDIANRGYAGANSVMVSAVTDQKELVYGDVNKLMSTGSVVFGVNDGQVIINDWSATSNGMIGNNHKAYGATSGSNNEEGVFSELGKIATTLFGKSSFSFSSKNASATGTLGGRADNTPRPAGNTHKKYQDAAHQNSRGRATFNIDLNILTHMVSNANLLEGCEVNPINWATSNHGTPPILQCYQGRYLVTSKTKTLMGAKYCERLTLTTNGV